MLVAAGESWTCTAAPTSWTLERWWSARISTTSATRPSSTVIIKLSISAAAATSNVSVGNGLTFCLFVRGTCFYRWAREGVNDTDGCLMSQCLSQWQCWQIIWWFTSLSGSDVLDDDISESVFGTKSGKPKGRKFYWDGPIEVELPNKVER